MSFKEYYFQKLDEISITKDQVDVDSTFEYDSAIDKVKVYSLELPHYFSQFGISLDDNYLTTMKIEENQTLKLPVTSQFHGAQITDKQVQQLKLNLKQINIESAKDLEGWQAKPSLEDYIVDINNTKIENNILTILFNKTIELYRSKNKV